MKRFGVSGISLAALAAVAMALVSACGESETATESEPSQSIQADATEVERPDAPEYGVRGVHAVGFRRFELTRPGADPLELKAWYPAQNPDGDVEQIIYEIALKSPDWRSMVQKPEIYGHALRDAPIDGGAGPYPLVVFSHGYALSPEWYSSLIEHTASHGFVVLAPEHGESDWFTGLVDATFDRPLDITDTIDYAEDLTGSGGAWQGLIDVGTVAVVGHSYGGYTALAAAGARIDLAAFDSECARIPSEDPRSFLCAPFAGQAEAMAAKAGLSAVPAELWPAVGDSRITAIVPIAGDAYLFGENGLASISVPVMAIGGKDDWGTPWAWGAKPTYENAASTYKALVGLVGGNHLVAANDCADMPFVANIEELYAFACFEPVWDKQRALDVIQHFLTAFLLDTSTGDAGARAALDPSSVWFPGVEYTSTLN